MSKATAAPASGETPAEDASPTAAAAHADTGAAGPAAMMTIPGGGGHALPGPLEEKHFAGEMDCDFETALRMVRAADSADVRRTPTVRRPGTRRRSAGVAGSLRRMLGLGSDDGARQDRHVAFDGFRNPLHDDKTERDRRYGTVYAVIEHANAYLVSLELPRRIPASSLKELWRLPDEMPDYDYSIALHGNTLAIRAGVRGEAMRRLPYVSASFPADFLTRIEFAEPVTAFKHRLRDKVLEIVVIKAGNTTASGIA